VGVVDWLQRLGGLTLEASVLPVGPAPGAPPCPSCSSPLFQVSVHREMRLFGLRLSQRELAGYQCERGHNFLRQSGFARWMDVALMVPVAVLCSAPAIVTGVWLVKTLTAWSPVDSLIALGFFAASALIALLPALSLRRRLRIALRQDLTWMDATFSASK
jgi:hypothetical protein